MVGMDNLDHDAKEDEYDEGQHRAMSLEGAKEINEECDHDEEPPFCRKCSAIYWEETRLGLDSNTDGKPIEYYLNENIVRWFWDRKENKET